MHFAREVVLYGLAMAVALATDVAILAGLVELAGVPYLLAAAVGFVAGGVVAYVLCVRFIFSHHRLEDRRVEAATFIALGLIGLAVNTGTLLLGVEILGMHYLVAKIGAAGASFVVNYAMRRFLLFTPARTTRARGTGS